MALHCRKKFWEFCHARYVLFVPTGWGRVRERLTTGGDVAETKHFIYFYLGHVAILLFKTQ
jgi:hypothetical protein